MKITSALLLSILWMMLSFVLSIQTSKAQSTQAQTENAEPVLSGSSRKVEDVILKSDAIFIGQITALGFQLFKSPGNSSYYNNRVTVLQILRGPIEPQITFTLHVIATTVFHEDPPKVGISYIFFVKRNIPGQYDPYIIHKLIPATDDNVAKVKALILAEPAGK